MSLVVVYYFRFDSYVSLHYDIYGSLEHLESSNIQLVGTAYLDGFHVGYKICNCHKEIAQSVTRGSVKMLN